MTPRTVRARLTALYSGLFLVTSTVLLTTVYLLVRWMLNDRVNRVQAGEPPPVPLPTITAEPPHGGPTPIARTQHAAVVDAVTDLSAAVQRYLWSSAAATIAVCTVVSVVCGWWLSGRLLRPVHRITATAQRLSLSNLHERIALRGPDDELKRLADTFDAMLDRLELAADSQRRFVANASHELRTPLAIQRATIQIGLDDPTPERLARARRDLLAANRRTERLIDGLLVLAQGERGLDAREPVALDGIVGQAVTEAGAAVRTDGGTPDVTIAVSTAAVTVDGDPVLLARLVANLVDNGVRYNRPGGRVQVELAADGRLTVRNTGPHVPADRVAELFEPFTRLPDTRTAPAAGTGLGLSIVSAIAHAHDAEVTAHPHTGGGLVVTVRFPLRADRA